MTNKPCTLIANIALATFIAGCGGSSGGGGGTFSTSVAGTKVLGQLSPADFTTLCNDFMSYSDGSKADSCKLAGFSAALFLALFSADATDADLKMACTMANDSCVADPGNMTCDPISATCTATVAELSACFTASSAATHTAVASLPACSALTRANLEAAASGTGGGTDTTPASCQTLNTKCPDDFMF